MNEPKGKFAMDIGTMLVRVKISPSERSSARELSRDTVYRGKWALCEGKVTEIKG